MRQLPILLTALFLCFGCNRSALSAVSVGDQPALHAASVSGQSIDLAKLKGKIVLVDFWATWCGPCMAEVPHMIQINNTYKDKGLAIIGISLDQTPAVALQGARQNHLDWPQICDGGVWNSAYAQQWGVQEIPHTFLIGPDGTVLWIGHPAEIDQPLADAFKNHPPQLIDPAILAQASAVLDQVEQALTDQKTADAIKLLATIPSAALKDDKTSTRTDAARQTLQADGQRMLTGVDPLIEKKDFAAATSQLEQLCTSFAGTPVGDSARNRLQALEADPATRAAITEGRRQADAAAALADAHRLQAAKKDADAYTAYQAIVAHFAGTSASATAAAQITEYEKDPSFVRSVKNAQAARTAKSALAMADSYRKSGRPDLAREKYQSIIQNFPGTDFADAAQKSLHEMDTADAQ